MRWKQWRTEEGADGATAPGIQPGGHPRAEFSLKNVGTRLKKKRERYVVTGA